MEYSWSLLFLISEWVIRLVFLVIVIETPRTQQLARMAWLIVVFFEPWIGGGLYFMFGCNRLPRRRLQRRKELEKLVESRSIEIRELMEAHHPVLSTDLMSVVKLASELGKMPIVGRNDVCFHCDSDRAIDALVREIEGARHHVHLMFYIFADDSTGRRVGRSLVDAVKRGVECRVLVDAVGSRPMLRNFAESLRRDGVEVVAMLPANLLRSFVARIDIRNHRKVAVIDGRVAFAGSQNIADVSYAHSDLAWRDLLLRVEGPVLPEFQYAFVADWYLETGEILLEKKYFPAVEGVAAMPVQVLLSGPNSPTENYQRMVVHTIHMARKSVTITTPYFVPDESLLEALQVAVLRGVEVTVILPECYDQILVGQASQSYYAELMEMGVDLQLYRDGLLHAKTLRIDDDLSFVGSSNFDIRSFKLNFELNIVLYGSQATGLVSDMQNVFLTSSYRLSREEWERRPMAARVTQNLVKLFSPLL